MNKLDTLIDLSIPEHKSKLLKFIENLEKLPYWITIKRHRKNRSKQANAYYWVSIIREICLYEGCNPDNQEERNQVHERLKMQFNSEEIVIKRRMYKVPSDSPLLEYNGTLTYLEKKEWTNLEVQDGCILFPLYVLNEIPENEIIEHGGQEIVIEDSKRIPKTTTNLDSVEHYEYIERIRDYYAIEHNVYLAPPSSQDDRTDSEFDKMYDNI